MNRDIEFFKARSVVDGATGCWLWTGARNHNGYGIMNYGRKALRAHRVSYQVAKGEIPDGIQVCHSCDTPRCVNPDHLWLGTNKDNALDATSKGRNPIVALKPDQVKEIRASSENTNVLSRVYGVGWNTIQNVRDGRTYRHIK